MPNGEGDRMMMVVTEIEGMQCGFGDVGDGI